MESLPFAETAIRLAPLALDLPKNNVSVAKQDICSTKKHVSFLVPPLLSPTQLPEPAKLVTPLAKLAPEVQIFACPVTLPKSFSILLVLIPVQQDFTQTP